MTALFGKYRAVVAEATDPLGRGRVRVVVPALGRSASGWAEACLPLTGPGTYVAPPVGAAVWVEFEAGDPAYPILCGVVAERG